MDIGIIGLGRMGANMARRWMAGGHRVVAHNRTPERIDALAEEGADPAMTMEELVEKLPSPRVVWLMLPAGDPVDDALKRLADLLAPGDVAVDGGNSYYKDDLRRAEVFQRAGIVYMDAGLAGGVWGKETGYCTMVGGPREGFNLMEPLLKTLAPEDGYMYCGDSGSAHFLKMVHNGMAYGMMQAYAEGFALLADSRYGQGADFRAVSHLFNQGSVVRSWLLELAENAFAQDPRLEDLEGWVEDSGEGRWTVLEAVESGTPMPVTALALMSRFTSRRDNDFSHRVLAALRREFGGHAVKPSE